MRRPRAARWAAGLLAAAMLGAGCGADDSASPSATPAAQKGGLVVETPVAPAPAGSITAVYLTVRDRSGQGDRLLGVRCERAERAMLHRTEASDEGMRMLPAPDGFPVPPNGSLRLEPGGPHAMLSGLDPAPQAGEEIPVTLQFERAGSLEVRARVVPYAQLERVLHGEPGP